MKRLRQWRRIIGALGRARVLDLIRLVAPRRPTLGSGDHPWDVEVMTCDACGCTMAYVADGWDRWVECTNSWCERAPYEDYDCWSDELEPA